ncbi:hypothetical protein QR685DRAFT_432221, partial [Neurospora intermedia]
ISFTLIFLSPLALRRQTYQSTDTMKSNKCCESEHEGVASAEVTSTERGFVYILPS